MSPSDSTFTLGEPMPAPLSITIDGTSLMILDALVDALDREPEAPDMDRHVGHHLEETARVHDDWQREVSAWRLVLGIQLVNRAIESRG